MWTAALQSAVNIESNVTDRCKIDSSKNSGVNVDSSVTEWNVCGHQGYSVE